MDASERCPDWRSLEFWRWAIEACEARPQALARWFPSTGIRSWTDRKQQVRTRLGITFPELDRNNKRVWPVDPPEGWPEYVTVQAHVPDGQPAPNALTTEEKVERDREIGRLKERLKDAEAKYEESLRGAEVEDRIIAALDRRVPTLPIVKPPTFRPRNGGKPETAVALVSDYHMGEVVSAEDTGGLAHYDWDTFMRRWQYHVDSIGGICFGKLTGYDIPRLKIEMLGDMVSGIIHDELVETAEGTVMEWVIDGGHLFAQGIRQLAAEFSEVSVDCVVGNHGRMSKQVRFKKRYVNWDYLFYNFVALELRDQPNVTFNIPKSFYMLSEVEGHHILNLHGDNIKSWSGIPWYGITRAVTNLSALLHAQRRSFDIVNLGHFHNAGTLDRIDCEMVLNGSAVGGNEFSIGAMFTSTQPRQVMYGMHPDRGRTWQYALDLSHGDDHESRMS